VVRANICQTILVNSVIRLEHLCFNLLEYRFFKDSERGVALPFGNLGFFSIFAVTPYILVAELIFFRAKRYLVRLGENVVGVVVFGERPDSFLVSSLGVAREYRRLGIATSILHYAERVARQLGKEWLELTVLKGNTAAQRLYVKFGFVAVKERRGSFILRKRVA
jgi:ribosomal protein S18 acetylase RimI-like enzyme